MPEEQQIPEYIGKGLMTSYHLSSAAKLKADMVKEGADERIVDFIINAALPKGSPKKNTNRKMAKDLFDQEYTISIINQAFNALTKGLLCKLLNGKEAAKLERIRQEEERQRIERKVPDDIALNNTAIKKAGDRLKKEFRKKHGLKVTGRIPKVLITEYKEMLMENMDEEVELV